MGTGDTESQVETMNFGKKLNLRESEQVCSVKLLGQTNPESHITPQGVSFLN